MTSRPHGGKRKGAGRKPGPHGAKVSLTIGISPDLKAYLESTGNASETTETALRRTAAFRAWLAAKD